ncbi:MAG: hypothetical protein IH789_07135 [Acidobacteria bacterium]|nr:hypothetical protein [Acidobacteriota bacterium]
MVNGSSVPQTTPSTVPDTTKAMIATLRASGMTWMQVASRLNVDGVPTGRLAD